MAGQCTGVEGPEVLDLSDLDDGDHGYIINGENLFDQAGISVRHAGDVNGDGIDDTIVGAHTADPQGSNSGRSYVVFGKSSGTAVELSDVAAGIGGFAIDGVAEGDRSGYSVAGAGDVNDDGFDDVIIGAWRADANGLGDCGQAYVVFGKNDTDTVLLSDVEEGVGGFRIDGEEPLDLIGAAVHGGVDINADGLSDVVVSSPSVDYEGLPQTGAAFVIFGKQNTDAVALSDVRAGSEQGFLITGTEFQLRVGHSVAVVPDMNGDGFDEILIGSYEANFDFVNMGAVYVVFGKDDTTPVDLDSVADGNGGFEIRGEFGNDESGFSVTGLQDMNGDGRGDFAIGARGSDISGEDSGRAYVVFGTDQTDRIELIDLAAGEGGFAINGEAAGDNAGIAVGNAGDVNNDGHGDVIVGAYKWGEKFGRGYVVFGKDDTAAVELVEIAGGDGGFAIEGEVSGSYGARAVDGAGDANGDGFDDLILASYIFDISGRSYVVFGGDCQPAP